MAETVVKTVASFAGNNKSGSLEQFGGTSLHLLKVLQQTIPLIRCITELKRLLGGEAETTGFTQIGLRLLSCSTAKLRAEPSGGKSQNALKLFPS